MDLFESDPTPVLEALKGKTLVIHNAAFDLAGFLAQLCYEHEGELIDTMLLSQLLYAGAAQEGSNLPCSGCGGRARVGIHVR